MLRSVQTTVWSLSKKFKRLDPLQKLLFLYLITNERTSLCGVYELDLDEVALRTGIDYRTLPEMFSQMEDVGIAMYRDGWVIIPNYKANYDNPSVNRAVEKCLESLPADIKSTYDRLLADCSQTPNSQLTILTRSITRTRRVKRKIETIDHPTLHVPIGETRYNNLVEKHGKEKVDDYIERVDNYVVSKDLTPYKDYAATAANWIARDEKRERGNPNFEPWNPDDYE